jgi:hypothetical protein
MPRGIGITPDGKTAYATAVTTHPYTSPGLMTPIRPATGIASRSRSPAVAE